MAPNKGDEVENNELNDEVVISGISGLFPNSNSVNEFMQNLYNKVDMVTSDNSRWNVNDPTVPKHIGKVEGFNKFDAQFFKVSYQVAYVIEPMAGKLLEQAYGAIFDSGTSMASLKGKKVGVFIGSTFADTSSKIMFDINKCGNCVVNGSSKSMFANRISYWLDGSGPSFCLDYSCAGSAACLEIAYRRIKAGDCDAALVGGCNYCLYPNVLKNMRCAGLLCLDGKTKCFDKNADGYVRSDAVGMLFLQKAKDAKRIYAEVCHVSGQYKMRPDAAFLPLRESEDIQEFLEHFYEEANVDPKDVEYVEANGAAIAKADLNEMDAISKVFAKDKVIKIGSVKSNMGNSEPASGVSAITKLCLAYHQGKLPGNLHYSVPHDDIPAVQDKRIQVVTENEEFSRGLTAVNNFSFTGANYHVLLKGHYKRKDPKKYQCEIPQLILASGRQEECAGKIFNLLKSQEMDLEQIALLRNIFNDDIPGHTARGYAILDTNEKNEIICRSESVDYYPGVKRPVWFVYSGMGSQWAGMGADLMRIPIFAEAIYKCSKVLEPKGIDLLKVVSDTQSSIFDDIINGFVGIGAIQIGLTDVLKALGIVPDYIIGHSLGEMACAYHDDTFTAEELILSTYCRGKVCLDSQLIKGSMAAIGIGYKAIMGQCPPDIDVACHNSPESTTVSGPAESMKKFVGELTARGIFAKEVACANIPYHSRYLKEAGSALLKGLNEIIKNPKPRSERWLSTSVPQHQWDEPAAKYSSAEYHTNNLLRPVLFEETIKLIPDNAIVIEIAPHGLLQAILKRSLTNCIHIPLTKRGTKDGVKFLMEAVGTMYQAGLNPKLDALYPKIHYPVSTETPLLSHFVEWEHGEDWPVRTLNNLEKVTASARNVVMSVYDVDHKYLEGHIRDGANVLPEAAILVLVWETLAMYNNMEYRDLSVVFKNIHFLCDVVIRKERPLKLSIKINRGDNKFEVCQDDILIATGVVSGVKVIKFHHDFSLEDKEDEIILDADDIYKVLTSRGFLYDGQFKSIHSSSIECDKARVKWTNEWVTFLDSLIQLNILARDCEGISVPKFIRRLSISMVEHEIARQNLDDDYCNVYVNKVQGITRCAGVEIDTITFTDKPVFEKECDVLETRSFFPYYSMDRIDLNASLNIILQIVAENAATNEIKVMKFGNVSKVIVSKIIEVADQMPIKVQTEQVTKDHPDLNNTAAEYKEPNEARIFVIDKLLSDYEKLSALTKVSEESFILAVEQSVPNNQQNLKDHFTVITSFSDGKQILILLKRAHLKQETAFIRIGTDNKFSWLPRVYGELKTTRRVVLISERQPYCGILGFVQNLRRRGAKKLSAIIIDDFHAPSFDPNKNLYRDQINKNLAINILKKGQWGSYYFSTSPKSINLRNATLSITGPGISSGLMWAEAPSPIASTALVQVAFAGLSLKDIEKATSTVKIEDSSFGMDYSGFDSSGDRVMGIVSHGSISSSIQADPDLLWPVPENWSLEEAATVPLPYMQAYYCLCLKVRLFRGQTVLVTGGAGAFGQAIIALCISMNCNVFTTVSTVAKKIFLLKLFPELEECNIGYSGDDSFHSMVAFYTKNKLCNLVINSFTGSLREAAMKCVGAFGFFLDLSKYDIMENEDFGMAYLFNERSYRAVDFSNIFRPENKDDKQMLQQIVAEGIAKGTVRPLTRVVYSPNDVVRAFRLLSTNRHRGRVLIKMRDPITTTQGLTVAPRIALSSNGVFVVICDETDLGIDLVDRLVKRGARKIVIHTKARPVSGYVQTKFASWMKQEVKIKLSSDNLQIEQGCINMLKDATKNGQVQGVFIVLNNEDSNDKFNEDEEQERFVNIFNKFATVVANLDVATRNFCKELSHFVVLARCSQNDSDEYAVSIAEGICRARNDIGYPALVLRYNVFHDSENKFVGSYDKLLPVPRSALFDAMEKSLKLKHRYVRTFNLKNHNQLNFVQKICEIIGVKSIDDVSIDKTVNDFKLNTINLEEIKSLIKEISNVNYHIEAIQHMPISSLQNIGKNETNEYKKQIRGLEAFYTKVEHDEEYILSSLPIVPMATLSNNGTEDDLDPKTTYLTMIPGFEGRPEVFTSIAERLKIQAVAVPLGPDMKYESIPQMAAEIRKIMRSRLETKKKFYLLGYSFGVNVALELAALLETEGHEGVVYCLDGSPDALRALINVYLGNITRAQLQNIVTEHAYYLMTGKQSIELKQEVENIENWSDKVECCLKRLNGLGNFSNQYKKEILESMYQKLLLAYQYKPKFKLRSQLVLIKCAQQIETTLEDDYGLSAFSTKAVLVYNIESDHTSAPHNCMVSNVINKLLDPVLLEEFKKKNLCDTYVIET